MKCPRCNEKVKVTDSTCPYCGYSISESNELFINPVVSSPEITEDTRTKERKDQDKYLQNNAFTSGKNWVKRYDSIIKNNVRKTRMSLIITILIIFAFFGILIGVTGETVVAVPMVFVLVFFVPILVISFKRKFYTIRDYEKYTILVYQQKNMIVLVIDDVEVMRQTLTNYPFELNCTIPGTKIPVNVTVKAMEFIIRVNNEA